MECPTHLDSSIRYKEVECSSVVEVFGSPIIA